MIKRHNFIFGKVWLRTIKWAALLMIGASAILIGAVESAASGNTDKPTPAYFQKRNEIAFVDYRVADPDFFKYHLSPRMPVHILGPFEDGLVQMIKILDQYGPLDAVHLFSHGSPGRIWLGAGEFGYYNIDSNAYKWSIIGNHLINNGKIFLYGCNVAKGVQGRRFIQDLKHVTAVDIAASTNLTGAGRLTGDWRLERTTADIRTAKYDLGAMLKDYRFVLAFPDTISFPDDPFNGNYSSSPYTVSTTDLGDVTFTVTDDGLGTANASLTWATPGVLFGHPDNEEPGFSDGLVAQWFGQF